MSSSAHFSALKWSLLAVCALILVSCLVLAFTARQIALNYAHNYRAQFRSEYQKVRLTPSHCH